MKTMTILDATNEARHVARRLYRERNKQARLARIFSDRNIRLAEGWAKAIEDRDQARAEVEQYHEVLLDLRTILARGDIQAARVVINQALEAWIP